MFLSDGKQGAEMDEKTVAVTIGDKDYALTPMTVAEHVLTTLLGLGIIKAEEKGMANQQVEKQFGEAVRAIIQTVITRADPAASIRGLDDPEVFMPLKKLCEISTTANIFDHVGGPIQ
jgi:citrate lyase gamma subunit